MVKNFTRDRFQSLDFRHFFQISPTTCFVNPLMRRIKGISSTASRLKFEKNHRKLELVTVPINKGFWIKSGVFGVALLSCLFLTKSTFAQNIDGTKSYAHLEKEIINQLNQERVENNLNPLKFNAKLKIGAKVKLNDLIKNNYFAHTSPKGVRAWDILNDIGYNYKYAGENLAMKFDDAKSVHRAWMKSKTHRDNILFADYTEVAVIVGARKSGSLVAVEFFGKPINNKIEIKKEIKKNTPSKDILKDEEGAVILKDEKNSEEAEMNKVKVGAQIDENNYYDGGTGNLLTQIVPSNKKVLEERTLNNIMAMKLSPDQVMSLNNMALLVVGIVCLILVVNIWVLEKEEERIILEAKKLCKTEEILVI